MPHAGSEYIWRPRRPESADLKRGVIPLGERASRTLPDQNLPPTSQYAEATKLALALYGLSATPQAWDTPSNAVLPVAQKTRSDSVAKIELESALHEMWHPVAATRKPQKRKHQHVTSEIHRQPKDGGRSFFLETSGQLWNIDFSRRARNLNRGCCQFDACKTYPDFCELERSIG